MLSSHRRLLIATASAALAIVSLCASAQSGAQTYPQRPVRIIVNVSPGGGVDNVARIVAQHFDALWRQPFVVDNRTGAAHYARRRRSRGQFTAGLRG